MLLSDFLKTYNLKSLPASVKANAIKAYQQLGRGVCVTILSDAGARKNGSFALTWHYVTTPGENNPLLLDALKTYDPARQAVITVLEVGYLDPKTRCVFNVNTPAWLKVGDF